jgi:hypothetical protein
MAIPADQDYKFQCSLFSLLNFWEFHEFARVLNVLESVAAPEYFGDSDILHSDYDRTAIEHWFQQTRDPREGRPSFELKRSSVPRYSMSINVGNTVHPHSLHLLSHVRHQAGELEQLFALADALATDLEIDFGSVDLYREGSEQDALVVPGGTAEHLGLYIENGPRDVWVRTYFGTRLVMLAGSEPALKSAGGIWRRLRTGVLALDLAASPWDRSPEELKAAQVAIAPKLRQQSGIFAVRDGNTFGDDIPGPRWQPPLNASWPAV